MNYDYKEGWWETANHRKIKISDMETSHIKSTIRYLQRHSDFYDECFGDYWYGYDYIDNSHLVKKKIEELQYELNKRRNNMKFKVGDKVKLNKNVKDFKYGKGIVGYDELGIIIEIDRDKDIHVNFPSYWGWIGIEEELVLVNGKKFFKKLPNDFTGTLEVEKGYIVEKEILDDVEREYLLNIIKPFKDKVENICKNSHLFGAYIRIGIRGEADILFPYFKKNTMYKGMEVDKKYTLKELGLDE